ncbi:glycosyltransferase [bacterium]|nr:glycosyltransferase [bacterium]
MNLSVIIPAYGRPGLLIRCLRSLCREMQGTPDYTVCVVDDGSGLDESCIRDSAEADYPLVWHSFPSNKGRSAARNEGIGKTNGDIVVFLDSDMEAKPGFLIAHALRHEKNPHAAVIGNIIWSEGGGFRAYIGSRGVHKLTFGEPVPPWYFVTGNASVRRSDLPSGKVFDEKLPGWGGEDLDLGLRLHKAGIGFVHAPEAVAYHHFEGTLAGHIRRMAMYGEHALPVLIARHPELYRIVRLDTLDRTAGRFAVNGAVYYPLFLATRMLDFLPLPTKLYDYLTFAAYARGWLKGRRS